MKSLVIDIDNFADWLTFADAKTCALLKEEATCFFLSRLEDILDSSASKKLKESTMLMTELMMEMARDAKSNNCFDSMQSSSVGKLREKLCEKGLDFDGSKQMLISCLRESNIRE